MPEPTIADAKDLACRYRKRGVLVLAFGGPNFALASYGHTRPTCDAMRSVVDQIGDLIADGTIKIPAALSETSHA